MTFSDLNSYRTYYLQTARKYLSKIVEIFNELNSTDNHLTTEELENLKSELHRLAHSLKSQSYFMSYQQLGDLFSKLEKIFLAIKENRLSFSLKLNSIISNTLLNLVPEAFRNMENNLPVNDLTEITKQLCEF